MIGPCHDSQPFMVIGNLHQCSCGKWWKIKPRRRPAWWARIFVHLELARQMVRWRTETER